MGKPISLRKERHAETLLNENPRMSLREIARIVGISKDLVRMRASGQRTPPVRDPDEEDLEPGTPSLRKVRPYLCPHCRQRVVYRPCMICLTLEARVVTP